MTSVIITGAAGRMGQTLVGLTQKMKGISLAGATEVPGSPDVGRDLGGVEIQSSLKEVFDHLKEGRVQRSRTREGTDLVVVDFTQPAACLEHIQECVKNKVSVVIGTTGFTNSDKQKIKGASKKIPIVMAPNMSVGVNTMFKLIQSAAQILGKDYDIEVLEAHHKMKKDAPSGTAVRLAEILADTTQKKYPDNFNFHRQGITGERKDGEIGMQVIRGGDIVGEHTVFYCGAGERIEIKHIATSRETFASGALRAAHWLAGREAGLYDMQDVLGIR